MLMREVNSHYQLILGRINSPYYLVLGRINSPHHLVLGRISSPHHLVPGSIDFLYQLVLGRINPPSIEMGFLWRNDCSPGFFLTHFTLASKLFFLAVQGSGALLSRPSNLEEALYKSP